MDPLRYRDLYHRWMAKCGEHAYILNIVDKEDAYYIRQRENGVIRDDALIKHPMIKEFNEVARVLGQLFNMTELDLLTNKCLRYSWLARYLLGCVCRTIESFYCKQSKNIRGAYTSFTHILTLATKQKLSDIRNHLTDEVMSVFHEETFGNNNELPQLPFPIYHYTDLQYKAEGYRYLLFTPPITGPSGAVGLNGPSGECHRCVIEDKQFLSDLKLRPETTTIPNDLAYPGDESPVSHRRTMEILGIYKAE